MAAQLVAMKDLQWAELSAVLKGTLMDASWVVLSALPMVRWMVAGLVADLVFLTVAMSAENSENEMVEWLVASTGRQLAA